MTFPPPSRLSSNAAPARLLIFTLICVLATIFWSSCERILSGIDPPIQISADDIPNFGSTPLPVLLGKEVVVRMDTSFVSQDSRGKAATVPAPQVNGSELHTMVTQVANALDVPYVAVFGLRDTLDGQWRLPTHSWSSMMISWRLQEENAFHSCTHGLVTRAYKKSLRL